MRVARCFDPVFAATRMDIMIVQDLVCITPIADMVPSLVAERNAYVQAARASGGATEIADMHDFTASVLAFWRGAVQLKAWRAAARIVFSIPPTSAASERVFARVKQMYGDQQLSALGDQIETGLQLAENGRALVVEQLQKCTSCLQHVMKPVLQHEVAVSYLCI